MGEGVPIVTPKKDGPGIGFIRHACLEARRQTALFQHVLESRQ
jgi:hypothetical protein